MSLLVFQVLFATVTGLWLLSLPLRNSSIMDLFWGFGFVYTGWILALFEVDLTLRSKVILAMVTLWGLRLTLHLCVRNIGKGEDYRYAQMRKEHGARYWWVSLFTVFWLQATLMFIISWPVQYALLQEQEGLTVFDGLGILLFLTGFLFESVGDWQLKQFRANPDNRGKVLDTGLWRYTRHPNYFGDSLLWWGLGCFALPEAPWILVSPLLMTFFLMKVTGALLLEKSLVNTKPKYADYIRKTPAFFPWFPKQD